jgi:predicted HAD superfamily Cof-like phosphohydrolase
MKNTYIEKVSEFHQTFNAPILSSPQVPSDDRCELRISLLQEELNELAEAIEQNNIIEIADALADIQ